VDKLLQELANPNLHDIPTNLPFRVEMWDRHDQHIRWVVAASSSVAIGQAALDTAIATYPTERFTLRNGILVIRVSRPWEELSWGFISRQSSPPRRERFLLRGVARRQLRC
jgi:hypothetical protein